MKKHLSSIILALIFITGLSLLLYPTVSDYWNSLHQSRAIASYQEKVAQLDNTELQEEWEKAEEYNKELAEKEQNFDLSEEELEEYNKLLTVGDGDVMAVIDIEKIDCRLPIYHTTSDEVLNSGVGHLPGSSLPIGGESTHCVLTGHRGLPSATLFTNLDKLEEGDTFTIEVLDQVLTYEVEEISIVLPAEVNNLGIRKGEDLVTLVTCTPYGVNTHRLLVTAHRTDNLEQSQIHITADAYKIDPILIAPIFAAILLLLLVVGLIVRARNRKKREKKDE